MRHPGTLVSLLLLLAATAAAQIRCVDCDRDGYGRIKRRPAAIREFRRANPCPTNGRRSGSCPGYEIDHRVPLHRGGADAPSNMRWLPAREHQEKTRSEARDAWRPTRSHQHHAASSRPSSPQTIRGGSRGGRSRGSNHWR
jgi:hypothetical protein